MPNLKSIIVDRYLDIDSFGCMEGFCDKYYQLILQYPLIFMPDNRIIFWGFEISLLKNEYNLLRTIIELNTKNPEGKFTEEEIISNINYKKCNSNNDKIYSFRRFIITSKSRIKKEITNAVIKLCIHKIYVYKYNPFIEGDNKDRFLVNYITNVCKKSYLTAKVPERKALYKHKYLARCTKIICQNLQKDKNFRRIVQGANLNLVKLHTNLLYYTNPFKGAYTTFILNNAIDDLLSPVNNQKHGATNRLYITNYIFSNKICEYNDYKLKPQIKRKTKNFTYAKINRTKFNLQNFVNR